MRSRPAWCAGNESGWIVLVAVAGETTKPTQPVKILGKKNRRELRYELYGKRLQNDEQYSQPYLASLRTKEGTERERLTLIVRLGELDDLVGMYWFLIQDLLCQVSQLGWHSGERKACGSGGRSARGPAKGRACWRAKAHAAPPSPTLVEVSSATESVSAEASSTSLYRGSLAMRSSCVPVATARPSSRSTTRSASAMVESR